MIVHVYMEDDIILVVEDNGVGMSQEDFEKLFDSISRVVFDKADRKQILKIKQASGNAEEAQARDIN